MVITVLKRDDTLGGSVTIPHKQTIIPFLDELTEDASKIQAVNTIQKVNGKLKGSNTDWWAIYTLTQQSLHRLKKSPLDSGLVALIIGAGGTGK